MIFWRSLFILALAILSISSGLQAHGREGCGDPDETKWRFVGCSYSPSECYYSCPSLGSYKAEQDPSRCFDPVSEWACYCPDELYD